MRNIRSRRKAQEHWDKVSSLIYLWKKQYNSIHCRIDVYSVDSAPYGALIYLFAFK